MGLKDSIQSKNVYGQVIDDQYIFYFSSRQPKSKFGRYYLFNSCPFLNIKKKFSFAYGFKSGIMLVAKLSSSQICCVIKRVAYSFIFDLCRLFVS